MEIKGKVIQKLDEETGTSKSGKQWRKQSIVLETAGEYPKKICFTMWGDRIDDSDFKVNDMITARVDIESREYNGRWYTDVKAWQVNKLEEGVDHFPEDPDSTQFESHEDEGDLPF